MPFGRCDETPETAMLNDADWTAKITDKFGRAKANKRFGLLPWNWAPSPRFIFIPNTAEQYRASLNILTDALAPLPQRLSDPLLSVNKQNPVE